MSLFFSLSAFLEALTDQLFPFLKPSVLHFFFHAHVFGHDLFLLFNWCLLKPLFFPEVFELQALFQMISCLWILSSLLSLSKDRITLNSSSFYSEKVVEICFQAKGVCFEKALLQKNIKVLFQLLNINISHHVMKFCLLLFGYHHRFIKIPPYGFSIVGNLLSSNLRGLILLERLDWVSIGSKSSYYQFNIVFLWRC